MSGYSKLLIKSFELLKCSYRVTYNVQGLALLEDLKNVRLEPQLNSNTKVEATKQKFNRITSAETAADSELQPIAPTSCPNNAKPLCYKKDRRLEKSRI